MESQQFIKQPSKMKKKIIAATLIYLFAGSQLSTAQNFRTKNRIEQTAGGIDEQKFSWGFYLAGNVFDYRLVLNPKYGMQGNHNAITTKPAVGFGAGLIGRMKLSDHFDLRLEPALHFVERKIEFNTFETVNNKYPFQPGQNIIATPTEADRIRNVKSTYLDVPIFLEYHGLRWHNSRPYAAAGLNWMTNLQSHEKALDDNSLGMFRSLSSNFAWSAEMGMQFYFNRFKLSVGVRGSFLINNELVADNPETPPYWAGAIDQLNSRAYMLVLKFE